MSELKKDMRGLTLLQCMCGANDELDAALSVAQDAEMIELLKTAFEAAGAVVDLACLREAEFEVREMERKTR